MESPEPGDIDFAPEAGLELLDVLGPDFQSVNDDVSEACMVSFVDTSLNNSAAVTHRASTSRLLRRRAPGHARSAAAAPGRLTSRFRL